VHAFDSTIPFVRRSAPRAIRPHDPHGLSPRGRTLIALLALVVLGSVGCMPNPMPPPTAPPIERYIVGAPDLLQISILPAPEILRDVRVRPDGKISIDLIGDVQAAGHTPQEIAAKIQQEIGRYKRDAAVNVTVVDSPSQFVTVFGEVARPGIFPLDSETRVSEAIEDSKTRGGPVQAVRRGLLWARAGAIFARLYVMPSVPNRLPESSRLEPVW